MEYVVFLRLRISLEDLVRKFIPSRARLVRIGAALVLIGTVFLLAWEYSTWNDPDRDSTLVNFASAWFPFAFSIFVAFFPDLGKMRTSLRLGIIFGGLLYSGLLWYQQIVNLRASRNEQRQAINQAVMKSTEHSDKQTALVREDLSAAKEQMKTLREDVKKTSDLISARTSAIDESIRQSKPKPTEAARLQFSFWVAKTEQFPQTLNALRANENGVFTLEFTVRNVSETAAKRVDIWVGICDLCVYANEPNGFSKREGQDEHMRHKTIEIINPGVFLEKMTIEVKVDQSAAGFDSFHTGFKYSCESCGTMEGPQLFKTMMFSPSR